MNRSAALPARLALVAALLPALLQANSDAANRAACREQAVAEGLRSEEVILDYIVHECLPTLAARQQPPTPAPGSAADRLGAPPAGRPDSAARLN